MSADHGDAAPVATYRLQVSTVGGLAAVAGLVPYLRRLGVSHLYLSPVLAARSGSGHGYDVVDPARISPEIDGERGLGDLSDACREAGLSLVLDIVPNHMAATHENPWWWDLLARGARSTYASFFDVDLDEPGPPARGRVILPILGRRYHQVLASGELHVLPDREGGFLLRYWEHVLPLDVAEHPVLGARGRTESEEREVLARLARAPTDARAREELDGLLSRQRYWLVHWGTAPEELNYRRFFDISHLVALRMERDEVFERWHAGLGALLRDAPVGGLRVDHVDGLADPAAYLARLRELVASAGRNPEEVLLLVEKILALDEPLPADWPVHGTTGYDFLALADGVLIDADGLDSLRRGWHVFTDRKRDFRDEVRRNKRRAVQSHFRRDMDRLVRLALPLVRADPRGRDAARSEVETVLVEVTVQLDVYRTYRTPGAGPRPADAARLAQATARARRARRELPAALFGVLHDLLVGTAGATEAENRLASRWQQLTGAVMAKGVEDTTFYVYGPLLSANEVGAEPPAAPRSPTELHVALEARGRAWPRGLNATSTHDTKRSEDIRARLHVLSELADEWNERVVRWHAWNRSCRETVRGEPVPTPDEEWMLYQTLVGVWPLEENPDEEKLFDRLSEYLRKAAREAKEHTSWYRPNPEHEEALVSFARRILAPDRDAPFRADLLAFQRRVAFHGAVNGLSLLLLKLAAPGIPDFYQGSELWALHLVDPDNRRPVDWARSRRLLSELDVPDASQSGLLASWRDGRMKLLLTRRGLACRARSPRLFLEGTCLPIEVEGVHAAHVVGFVRRLEGRWALALAPRLSTALTGPERFPLGRPVWQDTAVLLPSAAPARWRDGVTGRALESVPEGGAGSRRRLALADALETFPVALLQAGVDDEEASAPSASRKAGTSSGPASA